MTRLIRLIYRDAPGPFFWVYDGDNPIAGFHTLREAEARVMECDCGRCLDCMQRRVPYPPLSTRETA